MTIFSPYNLVFKYYLCIFMLCSTQVRCQKVIYEGYRIIFKWCDQGYTHAIISFPPSFLAVNHQYHKNWIPSMITHNLWLIFMGMKQKIQNGWLKKTEFFNSANPQYFFVKISWMGPWVSGIDWCKGHWFFTTYMAVRLSGISLKTA